MKYWIGTLGDKRASLSTDLQCTASKQIKEEKMEKFYEAITEIAENCEIDHFEPELITDMIIFNLDNCDIRCKKIERNGLPRTNVTNCQNFLYELSNSEYDRKRGDTFDPRKYH